MGTKYKDDRASEAGVILPKETLMSEVRKITPEEIAAAQAKNFVADLERLKNTVQMECVIFFKSARGPDRSSGQAYLQQKASMQRTIDDYVSAIKASLSAVAREIRAKGVNNGSRIYCLLERGQEALFRSTVERVVVPEGLERRTSGPWPPAEFLSDAVKGEKLSRE